MPFIKQIVINTLLGHLIITHYCDLMLNEAKLKK